MTRQLSTKKAHEHEKTLPTPSEPTVLSVLEEMREAAKISSVAEWCRLKDLPLDAYRKWVSRNAGPELDLFFRVVKALGYSGLNRVGHDIGEFTDLLRGNPDETRHLAHHWLEEAWKKMDSKQQKSFIDYLMKLGGTNKGDR